MNYMQYMSLPDGEKSKYHIIGSGRGLDAVYGRVREPFIEKPLGVDAYGFANSPPENSISGAEWIRLDDKGKKGYQYFGTSGSGSRYYVPVAAVAKPVAPAPAPVAKPVSPAPAPVAKPVSPAPAPVAKAKPPATAPKQVAPYGRQKTTAPTQETTETPVEKKQNLCTPGTANCVYDKFEKIYKPDNYGAPPLANAAPLNTPEPKTEMAAPIAVPPISAPLPVPEITPQYMPYVDPDPIQEKKYILGNMVGCPSGNCGQAGNYHADFSNYQDLDSSGKSPYVIAMIKKDLAEAERISDEARKSSIMSNISHDPRFGQRYNDYYKRYNNHDVATSMAYRDFLNPNDFQQWIGSSSQKAYNDYNEQRSYYGAAGADVTGISAPGSLVPMIKGGHAIFNDPIYGNQEIPFSGSPYSAMNNAGLAFNNYDMVRMGQDGMRTSAQNAQKYQAELQKEKNATQRTENIESTRLQVSENNNNVRISQELIKKIYDNRDQVIKDFESYKKNKQNGKYGLMLPNVPLYNEIKRQNPLATNEQIISEAMQHIKINETQSASQSLPQSLAR